jgi:iron complex transport system ATP-binding protein
MPILEFKNVSCGYGKKEILKNVSFKIKKGQFIGIIGPNGAGKSTLINTATRIIKSFGGMISVKNKYLQNYGYKELAKIISCVRQENFFSFPYKVKDMVMMGRFPHQSFIEKFPCKDEEIVNEALIFTDTNYLKKRHMLDLSTGEKQRVMIARALAQQPEILFLDEPTSHLDIGHQVKIFDMLNKLNKQKGLTVFCVLHDLNLASEYCDKLMLLNSGKIIKFDVPNKVIDYNLLEKTYDTLLVVKNNPVSGKPYVVPVSEEFVEK